MHKARISGVGHYVPPKVMSNEDLSKLMDTSNEWIIERTGIQERRFADPKTDTTSVMGSKAAKVALERAGIEAGDLDFIIFATLSPDYYFPGPGVMVQEQLGIPEIGALKSMFGIRVQSERCRSIHSFGYVSAHHGHRLRTAQWRT
jgi:3-oxoacyl-[acyl-carrier-protein] synthase-3